MLRLYVPLDIGEMPIAARAHGGVSAALDAAALLLGAISTTRIFVRNPVKFGHLLRKARLLLDCAVALAAESRVLAAVSRPALAMAVRAMVISADLTLVIIERAREGVFDAALNAGHPRELIARDGHRRYPHERASCRTTAPSSRRRRRPPNRPRATCVRGRRPRE